MYIKRYTIASAILIALVGWYVYAYVTQATMSIEFFGIVLPQLSISLWVILPLVIFYIASVLHMSIYSLIGSFRLRKFEKDSNKLIDAISAAILNKKDRNHKFKTPRYKLLGAIVDNSTILPDQGMSRNITNNKINDVVNLIENIKNGNVVDLKPYSLSQENKFVLQNNRNRYKSGEITAEDILSNSNNYDESLCKEAYLDIVKITSLYTIEKYKTFLTKESFFELLSRLGGNEYKMDIPNENILLLLDGLAFSEEDYFKLSLVVSNGMLPEQRIKLFEVLSEKNEIAMRGYLYTLLDLEMITLAKDIIENSQDDEFLKFKAYLALKESNHNFSIDLFI
jgi:hypothetical protein